MPETSNENYPWLEATEEPSIEDFIRKARELTPQQTRVTEPAFEELIKAVEKINELMTAQITHPVEFIRGDDEEEAEPSKQAPYST